MVLKKKKKKNPFFFKLLQNYCSDWDEFHIQHLCWSRVRLKQLFFYFPVYLFVHKKNQKVCFLTCIKTTEPIDPNSGPKALDVVVEVDDSRDERLCTHGPKLRLRRRGNCQSTGVEEPFTSRLMWCFTWWRHVSPHGVLVERESSIKICWKAS